jgi:hypothetical protein
VTPDIDVEIEFPACRCRVPQSIAQAVQESFEANGLRVVSRVAASTPAARELIVKRVERMRLEVPATRGSSARTRKQWFSRSSTTSPT